MATDTAVSPQPGGFTQRVLGGIERVGNKVPHPVLMFLYLIIGVIVLSQILFWLGVSVTETVAQPVVSSQSIEEIRGALGGSVVPYDPDTRQVLTIPEYEIVEQTTPIRGLLTGEGINFIFTSFLTNFSGFAVVGVTFIALLGAGVAEEAGLMSALIRKLVAVAPGGALTFIIIFVGVLSSLASDAGYLILIPLAAAAFASTGRHPLIGLAAAYAGVACIFTVNVIPTPTDAMLTEITNESIAIANGQPISIVANWFFNIGSSLILALVATVITNRIVAPRLGAWTGTAAADAAGDKPAITPEMEAKGLQWALWAFLGVVALVLALTLIPGAPLRRPEGQEGGNAPIMDSLLFIITLFFLLSGIAFGVAVGTVKSSADVIRAVTKTFSGLGGMVFMLLMISQFIAVFNFSNIPTVLASSLAGVLESANIGALPLLILMTVVILLLDVIMPGSVPKWAIFAPIFVPLFIRLGVAPQSVLAAYRIGDAPLNAVTPLMVYLPFIVLTAQRYDKSAGIGTILSLMIPYSILIAVAWLILFTAWFVLGIPLGPGYSPSM